MPPENLKPGCVVKYIIYVLSDQVGYIEVDEKVEEQTCPGDMPEVDASKCLEQTRLLKS